MTKITRLAMSQRKDHRPVVTTDHKPVIDGSQVRVAIYPQFKDASIKDEYQPIVSPEEDVTFDQRISVDSFIQAAEEGDLRTVSRYVDENKDDPAAINVTNQDGNFALILAVRHEHIAVVRFLLTVPGIDINAANDQGQTALKRAAYNGVTEVVRLLLAMPDIAINAADIEGNTALIDAAVYGHDDAQSVRLLLAMPGIDINAVGYRRLTALTWAASNGCTEVVRLLLEMPGIDINAADINGWTALMSAVSGGYTEIVRLLLAMPGIAINAANKEGNTALMLAAAGWYRGSEIVHLLLLAGADTTLTNKEGETAEERTRNQEIRLLITCQRVDEMRSAYDEIRRVIQGANGPEMKLEAFERKRAALSETKVRSSTDMQVKEQLEQKLVKAEREKVVVELTEDEKRIKEKLEQETLNLQMLTSLSFRSAKNDIEFILKHRDKIHDFSSLPELIVCFSELMRSLTEGDKALDEYSRTLLQAAAQKGDETAKHIVANYAEVKTEEKEPQPVTSPSTSSPVGEFVDREKEKMREARLKIFGTTRSKSAVQEDKVKTSSATKTRQ